MNNSTELFIAILLWLGLHNTNRLMQEATIPTRQPPSAITSFFERSSFITTSVEIGTMYYVLEFDGGREQGDIGIVHEKWLTPKKKETHWPPHKFATRFHKSLINGEQPEEEWKLFPVKRIFYTTDDILKAREKEKQAVIESDVHSSNDVGEDEKKKRKRKPCRKLLRSSSDDSSDDCESPKTFIHDSSREKGILTVLPSPPPHPENGNSSIIDNDVEISLPDTVVLSDNSGSHNSSRSQDIVLNKVCRFLSTIQQEIKEIKDIQTELLALIKPNATEPFILKDAGLNLPCQTEEDVVKIEDWIGISADNNKKLEHILSTVGGKKTEHITRRILEKLFNNQLAVHYNWTGKNGKVSLKGLTLISTIKSAVRANPTTINASDDEIESVIKNWFRFSKDRDGGRESRRSTSTSTSKHVDLQAR